MTVQQLIDALCEVKDKRMNVVDANDITPDGYAVVCHRGVMVVELTGWKKFRKSYVVGKEVIDNGIEVQCLSPDDIGPWGSKDHAILIAVKNIYDEIGWNDPDLKGKLSEVCECLASGKPYSFANCVWHIQEV